MKTKLMMLGLILVVAAALMVVGCAGKTQSPQTASPSAGAALSQATAAAEKPKTPVVIEAYYPFNEGHKFIADYLKSLEISNPGKITVTLYDYQQEDARKKWRATGLSCAGVFVNGKTHHEIVTNGKKEGVDFLQRMDVFWAHKDLETVIKQILKDAGQTFTSPNYKPAAAAPVASETKPEAKPGAAGK